MHMIKAKMMQGDMTLLNKDNPKVIVTKSVRNWLVYLIRNVIDNCICDVYYELSA